MVLVTVVVVVVVAPKWNDKGRMRKGVSGAREDSTDGFHLPDRRDRRKTVVAAAVAAAVDP